MQDYVRNCPSCPPEGDDLEYSSLGISKTLSWLHKLLRAHWIRPPVLCVQNRIADYQHTEWKSGTDTIYQLALGHLNIYTNNSQPRGNLLTKAHSGMPQDIFDSHSFGGKEIYYQSLVVDTKDDVKTSYKTKDKAPHLSSKKIIPIQDTNSALVEKPHLDSNFQASISSLISGLLNITDVSQI